jgi:hypothetical protein
MVRLYNIYPWCYDREMVRQKDPRQLPVQLNINVPWAFREFLIEQADMKHMSLNKLCADVLVKEYGAAFGKAEADYAKELTRNTGALR